MRRVILCVDDEALILLSLAEELRGYFGPGYVYETATSADEALEIIEEVEAEGDRVAVLISDLLMPGMRGDELLLRLQRRNIAIPSIMLTGHADLETLERLKEQSVLSAYLRKPWQGTELRRIVESCLENREAS